MRLNDYIERVKQLVPVSVALDTIQFRNAVNLAREELAQVFDPLIVYKKFVIDAPEVDIPSKTALNASDILKVLTVSVVQNKLRYEIPRGYRESIRFDDIKGLPHFYYLVNYTIGFYPDPSGFGNVEAELKLSLRPAPLLGLQEEDTVFDDKYLILIVYLTCSHVANMCGNAPLAQYFHDLYSAKKTLIKRVML